jgi:hypothetical protein
MKITLRQQILHRFKKNWREGKNGFVNAQVIEDIMHPITGRKHETIGRELRRMAEEDILIREEMKIGNAKVASVYYKYVPSHHELLSKYMQETI